MWMISAAFCAEAVDAQQRQRLAMKQQLEHAHRLAGDLCPGQVLEHRLADFVGHLVVGQLPLGLADR